jgi:hypothetical protein
MGNPIILRKGNSKGGSKMRALRLKKLSTAITTIMAANAVCILEEERKTAASG